MECLLGISIKNPDESVLAQEILFLLGHSWLMAGKCPTYVTSSCIYLWSDYFLTYGTTTDRDVTILNFDDFLDYVENL